MKRKDIVITSFDKKRLEELITVAGATGEYSRKNLYALGMELKRARMVFPEEIPPYVVTMNSEVNIKDCDTSDDMTFRLVFPNDANITVGAVSILAPIGTAILGYSEGDEIDWTVPAGVRRIKIEKILYQPEAAGDFHL